ncbi:MAG TPA: hypothetical protein VHK90_05060, partial [Thermoanaerobaculia bacterium]|nr:hypothetical protein [Thermoanaerobaculia bacterium]
FAVPTHDFRGAWMIQRETGRPTTLLRHDPVRGLETMWSDPTGRQVEALIPGLSGETLLVQVHVPRDVSTAVPFVDPALAVWHIGDPAPSEYHELYLNEEANKGFIHVDVDRIEGGEPFVFTSGLLLVEGAPEEGPVSPPIQLGGDVVQEWGVVRASFAQRLVLPGVTRTAGANGSQWSTDVTIFNPLDVPQDVEIRYVAAGTDASLNVARLTRTITLAPRQLNYIHDVLNSLFLVAASGGTLYFTPEVGVSVFGRTYTRREYGGMYGYGMNAIDFYNAAGPRFAMTFSAAFPGSGYRTNVMLTDTSGRGAEAMLMEIRTDQRLSAATSPSGVSLTATHAIAFPRGGLLIRPTRGTIIPAVVTIDNITNDPTYMPPDLPAPDPRMIPMIVATDEWTTDLYLYNASPYARVLRMEATSWDGLTTKARSVYIRDGEAMHLEDALRTWFGMTGTARLRYVSDDEMRGEGIRVTSRLYRTLPGGGTYGTLVPALNNFQLAAPGDTLGIIGIAGAAVYRTDLALVESSPNGAATTARIRIIDDRGEELDAFETTVRAREGMTIDDLFARRGITPPRAARITIEVLEGGMLGTFATLVDRRTGDPTYLPAGLQAK